MMTSSTTADDWKHTGGILTDACVHLSVLDMHIVAQ